MMYKIKNIKRLLGSTAYEVFQGQSDTSLNFTILERILEHHYKGGLFSVQRVNHWDKNYPDSKTYYIGFGSDMFYVGHPDFIDIFEEVKA